MFGWTLVVLLSLKCITCDDSVETTADNRTEVSITEESYSSDAAPVTEGGTVGPGEASVTPDLRRSSSRPPRRRSRRFRGFYNDVRYRNPANNPYNPNSPYAFRGRPGQPPMAYRQQPQGYNEPYDPYNQYYGYQGYPAPQQPQYYPYPYPQQVRAPQPPTPALPSDNIPDLYYVQKPDTPDGQYQYKKVSVVQDTYYEGRSRRRPTRWPQQPYGGYYNYPYNPYDRRPPPPPPQQSYYQYPQQYPPYYQYPRGPGVPRSRFRTGRPPLRPTIDSWTLTLAPVSTLHPPVEQQLPTDLTTEPSGD